MTTALFYSLRHSLQLLLAVFVFAAPACTLAFADTHGSADKHGAGLVLYVTLERNAMN